jgi:hypothetical protein
MAVATKEGARGFAVKPRRPERARRRFVIASKPSLEDVMLRIVGIVVLVVVVLVILSVFGLLKAIF